MYSIEVAPEAQSELRRLRPFDARPVYRAVAELRSQARIETRNRKPLRSPLDALPEASWEIRVGRYRVLYAIAGLTVRVLRVIVKGRETLSEALTKDSR